MIVALVNRENIIIVKVNGFICTMLKFFFKVFSKVFFFFLCQITEN